MPPMLRTQEYATNLPDSTFELWIHLILLPILRQSHTTLCTIDKYMEDGHSLKALKQKLFVDGLSYLLQEIYGLENKSNDPKPHQDDDVDDTGAECVVCMVDLRDTIILPCRHVCLCYACADCLR